MSWMSRWKQLDDEPEAPPSYPKYATPGFVDMPYGEPAFGWVRCETCRALLIVDEDDQRLHLAWHETQAKS